MKKKLVFLGILLIFNLFKTRSALAISISNISAASSTVRVYEKYEVKFNVNTTSEYPFFQYDTSPPPGVTPGVGVTVEGIFTTPSGKVLKQPAFYMVEVAHTGSSGSSMRFYETGNKYWMLRFSPQEQGTYQVKIRAEDASGTTEVNVGTFTATPPVKDGFIKVSKNDSRYFEFSNGKIYWPIGPAWVINHSANPNAKAYDYSQYKDTGQNLDRFWMIGVAAYTGVGSRWISSAERLGNEGYMARLNYNEHYPGHELSYEIFYPQGYRIWLTTWEDELLGPRVKRGVTYQVKLVYKTQNLSGPSNRCPSCDWGFVIRTHNSDIVWANPTMAEFESAVRNATKIISHQKTNHDWQILTATFTAPEDTTNIDLYLDNVNGGQVYIDEFSMIDLSTGGDIIRQKRADIHTYVDPKGAGFIDWQVEQAEQNGVFLRYVVHDKNDWVQNHLNVNGVWTTRENAGGYYQPENTKARWLVRQWYRYLIARWGYSTAIQSWELNNEGPPNSVGYDSACGCDYSSHWRTAQAFAKFMHENDVHPHLVSTSFWCCWRPKFWGCSSCYPDIDFADIHDYLNPDVSVYSEYYGISNPLSPYREVEWYEKTAELVSSAGKPVIRGETGIDDSNGPMPELKNSNQGIYYHNMLWVQLHSKVMFDPNYWWQEHLSKINREQISKVFWNFVKNLDLNKGGFAEAAAQSSNSKVKVYGQKNVNTGKAYLWVWHTDHTWKKALDNPSADYSLNGNVNLTLKPNTDYKVEWWDTYNYSTGPLKSQTITSNSSGVLSFSVDGYNKDIAVKIENKNLISSTTSTPQPTVGLSVTPTTNISPTPVLGNGDVNQDGKVDLSDISTLFTNWLNISIKQNYDQYKDGIVNTFDYAVVAKKLSLSTPILSPTNTPPPTPTATPTPQPTATPTIIQPQPTLPPTSSNEWTQFAFNAQRTSYTPKEVPTPWRWKWAWNGPTDSGGIVSGKFKLPRNVQPVTGGGQVYVAAGANGVYALSSLNGSVVWNQRPSGASINSTVAYDPQNGVVFAIGTNGVLYKLNATNGNIVGMYNSNASSSFALPPLIVGDLVIFSMGNKVHALTITTLQPQWVYDAGIAVDTPPAYSQKRNVIIVGARDLYFHGINATNGTRVWRNRPTVRTDYPANGTFGTTPMTKNQAEVAYGWPVVSDANDIVLVTYRLDWNTLWTWSPWPTTNEQMRQNLTNNPGEQAVFALNLQTGNEAFKINLTSGGFGDGDYLPMGNIPIVKRESNGNEVAYAIIRGDNRPGVDGRGDSKFGEVILNNNTVTGYQPGYVRFIAYNNYGWPDGAGLSYMPSDEMPFLSMAGNYLFGGHWMAGKGLIIENRDSTKGSFSNPITSRPIPHIVNSTNSNTTQNCAFSKTHYCSASVLYQEGDTRSFAGPGFYIYYGNYSPAVYDRYWVDYAGWVISDNMVLFRSTDGAIIALENGNPLTQNFVASTNGQVAGAETVKQSNEKTPGPNIIPVDSASAFIGQYKTVEGTVVDVFDNKKAIYITFSKPHTGKLLVRIKGRPYQSLKNDIFEKIKPNDVIRVTGRIDMYRGDPVIYVENLNQIKKPPLEKNNLIKNFSLKWSTKIFNKN